jgi:FMN phosphatase YigB (HAD superfamily)
MKQKTIIFDVDGVLADFVMAFTKEVLIHDNWDSQILKPWGTRENRSKWNFSDVFTKQQIEDAWSRIKNDPEWWIKVPSMERCYTFDRIDDLQGWHHVLFVTARVGKHAQWQTQYWLEERGVRKPNVVVTDKKGEIAAAVGAHYHVDDKPENAACVHWIADRVPCKSYFVEHDYRKGGPWLPEKIRRIKSVNEYLEDIENDVA